MNKLFYPAIFHVAEEGGFWITFPDLPECMTQGTDATPAVTAGLADHDVGVLGVAHDADGGAAGDEDTTQLGGGHAQDSVAVVLAHELDGGAG